MFVKIASLLVVLVLVFGAGIISVQAEPPEPHQGQTAFQNAGTATDSTSFQFQTQTQLQYAHNHQLLHHHMFRWGTLADLFVPGNPWVVEGAVYPAGSPSLRGYGFGFFVEPIVDILPQ